jgi:hypothetical protein
VVDERSATLRDDVTAMSRSRALPIAVAAGLATGVFAGLLVVRGGIPPGPSPAEIVLGGGAAADAGAIATRPPTPPTPPPGPADAGPRVVAAAPPDAGPRVVAAAPPDAGPKVAPPPVAATRDVVLSFVVEPPDAIATIDGEQVVAGRHVVHQVGGEPRKVKLEIRAPGFRTHRERLEVGLDRTVEIKLRKERKKPPPGPGDLIDLGPGD